MSITLQRPDLSVSENDVLTLFIRLLLQQKVVQMFFMPKHINLENLCKLTENILSYEVWYLTNLLGLVYKTFQKNIWCQQLFHKTKCVLYSLLCNGNLQ